MKIIPKVVLFVLASVMLARGSDSAPGGHRLLATPFGTALGFFPLIAAYDNRVYILDDHTNRLFICDEAGNITRIAGSIGSGPGQFYKPSAMTVTSSSIVIYDKGNRRIEVLTHAGTFKADFPVSDDVFGMAAGDDGLIYVNDPSSGKLITALDPAGKVVRSFGLLKQLSELYHTPDQSRDKNFYRQANRVRLAVDKSGHIYATFVIAPVIHEYAPDGSLVREAAFGGDIAGRLRDTFWRRTPPQTRIVSGILDDKQVPFLVKDIAADRATNQIIVLTAFATLFVFNSDCQQLTTIQVQGISDWQLWKIAVDGQSIWFVRVFLPGSFHAILPKI